MAEIGKNDYNVCDQCRAKKIRCGREKPSCANCSRQGQRCEWSGQGKKFNQTAFLSRTVKELSSRLQILETSMLDNRGTLKRPRREPLSTSPSISALDSGYSRPPDPQSKDVERHPRFTRPLERFLSNHSQGLGEKSFGPTSLEALMLDIKDIINGDLGTKTDKISEFLLSAQNKLRLPMSCGEEYVKDESPSTAPPRAILDAMIEPYFAEVNPQFPIWTREQFSRMTTALEQSSSPEQDVAAIVCCNNLILMTMTVNSLRSRWSRSFQTKQTYEASSVDSDITAGFLTNAKRAIRHIKLLLSPCLVNIQALLSLCVVAQEHLSSDYLENIFALAAQCAKSAGIHHWQSFRGHVSDKEVQERRNVSYCLYILDKTVGWTTGTSPSIPMSCLQMDSSFSPLNGDTTTHLLAKTELATIKETIYLEEYSNQVGARTSDQVRHVVARISQRLGDWLTKWHIDLDELENNLEQSPWKARLAIDFLCVQLLLLWPYQDHIDVIFQQQIDVARRCMRFMLCLWRSTHGLGDLAGIMRFLMSNPPLYLYTICAQTLRGHGQQSGKDLLRDYTQTLQVITEFQGEDSYIRRLCKMSHVLMDIVAAKKTTGKRQKTDTLIERPTAMPTPKSGDNLSDDTPSKVYLLTRSKTGHLFQQGVAFRDHSLESDLPSSLDISPTLLTPPEQLRIRPLQGPAEAVNPTGGLYMSETWDPLQYSPQVTGEDYINEDISLW